MIKLYLGNIGSGKTACAVRDIYKNINNRMTYSNIITKKIKNNTVIKPDMIFHRELLSTKKTGEKVYKYTLNEEFWKSIILKEKAINIIIDEAHSIFNSRQSMTKKNRIMAEFLSLLRRVLGSTDAGYGELIMISQLIRRLDIIVKEMATQIRWHKCHYKKKCRKCGFSWQENNEVPEAVFVCAKCGSNRISKYNHIVEVWHFQGMQHFTLWYEQRIRTYHKHYLINDIEKYFPYYDTLQWDNLISDY